MVDVWPALVHIHSCPKVVAGVSTNQCQNLFSYTWEVCLGSLSCMNRWVVEGGGGGGGVKVFLDEW